MMHCSFGQLENAQRHAYLPGQRVDQFELQKLRLLEKHLSQCTEARKIGDWKSALRESEAAIADGADFSPQVDSWPGIAISHHSLYFLTCPGATYSLLLVKQKPV